ncbi:uncharacterized protein LOC123008972 [Tribolium madens]|uniref:uncharacterized protein LOC123005544 n=1 Tax=Tribolium madens TaxID=41895 RepID=UPI001CF750D2|nr:uncharacterized protein LOC123005544 [Tribolium madens]XP_044260990.1 uncharacterized protein LOC123008972 [Tribolium madens]
MELSLDTLNKIAACEYPPEYQFIHPTDLEVGKPYKIINISQSHTKNGLLSVAHLEGMGKLFLPQRLTPILTQDIISSLLDGEGTTLIYKGLKNLSPNDFTAHIYDFKRITPNERNNKLTQI